MNSFRTVNPATEEVLGEYSYHSPQQVAAAAEQCRAAFLAWREVVPAQRAELFLRLSGVLRQNNEKYARLITLEMGKPIKEARGEIEKCAWSIETFANQGPTWLSEEAVQADGRRHAVVFEPLGVVLAIMPWNFPFWQVFRCAVPAMMAGNGVILKHADSVTQCAFAVEEAFRLAGFPINIFKMILADHPTTEALLVSDQIQAVSLTGSTRAGQRIGELAGHALKKMVLELGGSDPFIVLEDAELKTAAAAAVAGRFQNCGQSCIAAKRILVSQKVAAEFSGLFVEALKAKVTGDPANDRTDIGPLVNAAALAQIETAVADARSKGVKVLLGGERLPGKGFFYAPTLLENIAPGMKVVQDELFGPVAPIITFKDEAAAVKIANATAFGLGASVWTRDRTRGESVARKLDAGSVFVNAITKSDPRMPFGGIKKSGLGRELSKYGLLEFVNVKGINIY